jgi:integrase
VAPHNRPFRRDRPRLPGPDGSPWNRDRANNWRNRGFADACKAAGETGVRSYDLRHSFVSLK